MKNIARNVYMKMKPDQRVIACVEALARKDEKEFRRLVDSCPMVTCHQTDPRFSKKIDTLMDLALAVQCELKESALRYFVALRVDARFAEQHLQAFANTRFAWQRILEAMGLTEQLMRLAGPPRSPILELIERRAPEPDRKHSTEIATEWLDAFRRAME